MCAADAAQLDPRLRGDDNGIVYFFVNQLMVGLIVNPLTQDLSDLILA